MLLDSLKSGFVTLMPLGDYTEHRNYMDQGFYLLPETDKRSKILQVRLELSP